MGLFGAIFGNKDKEMVEELIANGEYTVVDVRSPGEYAGGCVEGSINIPLSNIRDNIDTIKSYGTPVILCCASGNRSGQATGFLRNEGMDNVYNGGGWFSVHSKIQAK